ncbi:unnamed protein product [Rhodiola kirilowii]
MKSKTTIAIGAMSELHSASTALMAGLAPKTKVLRDGKWNEQDAAILFPGDNHHH